MADVGQVIAELEEALREARIQLAELEELSERGIDVALPPELVTVLGQVDEVVDLSRPTEPLGPRSAIRG